MPAFEHRLAALERDAPAQTVHVVEIPQHLPDHGAIAAQLLADAGIVQREADLTIILHRFADDGLPRFLSSTAVK